MPIDHLRRLSAWLHGPPMPNQPLRRIPVVRGGRDVPPCRRKGPFGRVMVHALLGVAVGSHAQEVAHDRIADINAPVLAVPAIDPEDIDVNAQLFAPRKAINHQLCRMGIGTRRAADLAVVVMPGTGGVARFAVLDGSGKVFDGELPFFPNNHALGRHEDGSVLVGFGGLAPNKESMLRADAKHAQGPVRIYRNGKVIFETDQAWQFDIASNGTSFFVIEPQAKFMPRSVIEPRLIIGNTTTGTENRFDIVDQLRDLHGAAGNNYPARYNPDNRIAQYSITEDEIMIGSMYKPMDRAHNLPGQNLFYPVTKGRPRFIVFSHHATVFASSRYGYFADRCVVNRIVDGRRLRRGEIIVTKKRFDWSSITEKTETVVWSRSFNLDVFRGMVLSDDDAHLVLWAINLHVLNTTTGEAVFTFPTEQNLDDAKYVKEYHWTWDYSKRKGKIIRHTQVGRAYYDAALKRLTNILPPGATIEDIELGGPIAIRQGRLAMTHRIAQGGDGNVDHKEFLYLFDMDGIAPDDKPRARVELTKIGWDNACVPGNIPEQGLQVRGGQLTYLTERLSFDAD